MAHLAAENFLSLNAGWEVIFIRNRASSPPISVRKYANTILELIFDDIDFPVLTYIMPYEDDVRDALKFSKGAKKLLVTCQGGMTRSAAIAYVCKCQEVTPEEAIKLLMYTHYPNRVIVEYAAKILKNQNVFDVYDKWVRKPSFNNVEK